MIYCFSISLEMRQAADNSVLKIGATLAYWASYMSCFLPDIPKLISNPLWTTLRLLKKWFWKSQLDFGLVEGPIHSKEIISTHSIYDKLFLIG